MNAASPSAATRGIGVSGGSGATKTIPCDSPTLAGPDSCARVGTTASVPSAGISVQRPSASKSHP